MSELRADTITSATDNTDLEIQARGTGVPNLESGSKLNGTAFGTAATLNAGTSANNLVQLDGSGNMPAVDGSALTGIAGITAPTAQASTSGTAVDFTGIPSGTVAIDFFWSDYSCSTAAHGPVVQIGDSGGIETTGYDSNAYRMTTSAVENQTDNFIFMSDSNGMNAGNVASMAGSLRLVNPASNTWSFWGSQAKNGANGGFGLGEKSLSGELDRIRFTTNDGDTLSAGIVRIFYW